MKINITLLVYLPIILLFLPAFSVYVPGICGVYPWLYIILYGLLGILLAINYNSVLLKLKSLYKYTPLKYIVWLFIYIFFVSVLNSITGHAGFIGVMRSYFLQIVLGAIPFLAYFLYIIDKYISFEKFFKLFVFLFWLNLIIGFISYIGQVFDIEIINNIFDFFANARFLIFKHSAVSLDAKASAYVDSFGTKRLDNLFEEPSFYAKFLFILLPMVYSVALNKIQIYSNKILNSIIKRTIIPFTWISLILTLSPIYCLFSIIITLIYFSKSIFKLIKKYFIMIIIFIFIVINIVTNIDFSQTFLSRIINVLINIHSFEDFIIIEPSLATRIVNYINSFCIFLKHPFIGVGLGNLGKHLIYQLQQSPVPLTPEIQLHLQQTLVSASINKFHFNYGFIYAFPAENGILALILYLYFFFSAYKFFAKICKSTKEKSNILYVAANSLKYFFMTSLIAMFYVSTFLDLNMNLLIFFAISFIYHYKIYIVEGLKENKYEEKN